MATQSSFTQAGGALINVADALTHLIIVGSRNCSDTQLHQRISSPNNEQGLITDIPSFLRVGTQKRGVEVFTGAFRDVGDSRRISLDCFFQYLD